MLSTRRHLLSLVVSSLLLPVAAFAAAGPSTSTTPYLKPLDPGVEFTSVLSVGDSVRKMHQGSQTYRMVGTPDGMGAFDNGDGTFTLLVNHEFTEDLGVTRANGGKGAFVSKWQIRKADLKVLSGEDQIDTVNLWNGSGYVATPGVVFSRFCSADLPKVSAL
jgi:hypothetical protein